MKAHIGVDTDSGLVHTVRGTSGHVSDIAEANTLLHGHESEAAGYQRLQKRPDASEHVARHVAMCPEKCQSHGQGNALDAITDKIERCKASIRAKVEHSFRVIKRQFGFVKVAASVEGKK